jgi:hypothetical protein
MALLLPGISLRLKGYFRTVAQLSREEFDAIEFGAARTGDHRAAAQQMNQLATTSAATSEMSRAEAYLRTGEQWLLADDPAAAARGFRQALADGGAEFVDARVSLARALYLLGRSDEASGLISQLEADGRRDPRLCDLVAELLVEQSDLIGALDWANAGVELCLPLDARTGQYTVTAPAAEAAGAARAAEVPPGADVTELRLLLSLRYRIRNDLGLDEDAYDKLLDEL